MYDIFIRKLSKETESRLKDIASRKGIGVETLARQVLTDFAKSPDVRFLDDRYKAFCDNVISLYTVAYQEAVDVIDKNNRLLEQLLDRGGSYE